MGQVRVSFVIDDNHLPNLAQLLPHVKKFMVSQHDEPVRAAEPALPAIRHGYVRSNGVAKYSGPGRICMQVVATLAIARGQDFIAALEQDGNYSSAAWRNSVDKLIEQGEIVRCGWGQFRVPTAPERASWSEAQAATASARRNPT